MWQVVENLFRHVFVFFLITFKYVFYARFLHLPLMFSIETEGVFLNVNLRLIITIS